MLTVAASFSKDWLLIAQQRMKQEFCNESSDSWHQLQQWCNLIQILRGLKLRVLMNSSKLEPWVLVSSAIGQVSGQSFAFSVCVHHALHIFKTGHVWLCWKWGEYFQPSSRKQHKEWPVHLPLAEPNLTWSRAEMLGKMETRECVGFKLVIFLYLIGRYDQPSPLIGQWLVIYY